MANPNGYIQGANGIPLELVDATARRQLAGKLDAPGNVKAGDYLSVKSVGEDGTVVVEGTEGPDADSGQNADEIPDYWKVHLAEKIAAIKELQRSGGPDCFSFVSLADYHRWGNIGKRSPALIRHVMDECGIKFCLNLGDIQNGGAWKTKDLELAEWELIEKDFAPIRDRALMIPGNHDGAYGSEDINGDGVISGTTDYYIYNLSHNELYDLIYRKVGLIPGVTFDTSHNGYYIDDPVSKVRYILVNTHYSDGALNEDGTATNNFMRKIRVGQPQQDMVIAALQSIPADDWHIVVGMHIPLAAITDSGPSGDMVLLRDVLEAYQNKTTHTGTYGIVGEYDHVSVNVDFAAAKGTVAGVFCGHVHADGQNDGYAFPIVTSMSDNTNNAKIDGGVVPGQAGTVTEQSFDVFTVNKREGAIYATKIGHGSDRVFSFGSKCAVTLNLTQASASNGDRLVQKHSSYRTTITAKTGFIIDSVVVTMSGVDITADVYADGVVSIDSVTGNIVITVVAIAAYTNLADRTNEDWCSESHYLNEGVLTVETNSYYNKTVFVSNYIPVTKGDILRWKGIDMESTTVGKPPHFACYDADKVYLRGICLNSSKRDTADGLQSSVVTDENGATAYEILIRGDIGQQFTYRSYCDRVKYVRLCAHWLTAEEDIVITVNEEIV